MATNLSSDSVAIEPGPPEVSTFKPVHTWILAAAVGLTSMSFNFWYPFLPLYVIKLGATSNANALFWVAIATSAQGIGRLLTSPVWGVLSDRYGRKMMFLRALYLSSLVGATAAFATAPWHIVIALTVAGLFSGFGPTAIAFVSVSVSDARLNANLSAIAGAQYIGTAVGPALGAVFAIVLGYRGAILAGALVPIVAGTLVLLYLPRDVVAARTTSSKAKSSTQLEPFKMSFQFLVAVFLYFAVFALNQLSRLVTPIGLRGLQEGSDVAGITGLAFTLGGIISVVSVLLVAPRFFNAGRFRVTLATGWLIAAAGFVLLAAAPTKLVFIAGFLTIAFVLSGMSPAINTLVAANASRARRGTAFGIAGSAQALSFVVGPGGAALFAAVSLKLGFISLAIFLVAVGAFVKVVLREPRLETETAIINGT